MRGGVLGGGAATLSMARASLRRAVRTMSLWIGLGLTVFITAIALILLAAGEVHRDTSGWRDILVFVVGLAALLAPLLVAAAIGEEVEDRTYAYLWSRPMPRWALVSGKLLATAPLATALVLAAAATDFLAIVGPGAGAVVLVRVLGGVAIGSLAICVATAGIATLVPRLALRLCYGYLLLFDLPIGSLPFSLRNLSLTYHLHQLAGGSGEVPTVGAFVWPLAIAGFWLALGLVRLAHRELGGGEA